jgi:hypothetical protein
MKNEDVVANDRSPASWARVPALLLAASASDWRQFRGPNGSGIAATEAQPAITWSDSQNVAWKVALPGPQNKLAGDDSDFNGTPAIAGRQLFLRSNRTLYCILSVQTAGAGKQQ